ncbi:hypothetical protein N7530_009394 [Penicillium desertorum]|uniref:Zn(2)-C6 fungal-type domain-containing protein n=1 Tax=Penicillium desertorum TaxID=1303715 RepID=A0A9W9WJ34_9EURO|nr:hypothetical protein N7530_009394 [Penicillium desertorum]
MIQRSQRGRHKKCDEIRPVCERCSQAGMACEGYETRLIWGPSDTTTPKTGTVLNPVRQSRPQRRSRRSRVADVLPVTRLTFQHLMEDSQERTDGSTEKVALDIVTNVWEMGKGQGLTAKLALATEFAAELNIELHLY